MSGCLTSTGLCPRCHGKDIFLLILQARITSGWPRIMETRESIIDDLRKLGVQVNQILSYRPTDQQLKEMRDGLLRLQKMKANFNKNS